MWSQGLERSELEKENIAVVADTRQEYTAGWKFNEWELKGVPVRIEIGPRDLEKKQAVVFRRDARTRESVNLATMAASVKKALDEIQDSLYQKSRRQLESSVAAVKNVGEIAAAAKNKKPAKGYFCGSAKCEEELKANADGASSRCMTIDEKERKSSCVVCGKEGVVTYFGKAY